MKKRTLKLKSVPSEIHKLEKFAEDICDENNINNTYFGNIILALTEAFENAMIHGNKSDKNKNITVCFDTKAKGLMFEVIDEGNGFNYNDIPDATDVEKNPEKKGTGIFMIKNVADEVRFIQEGRCIQMMFFVSSINQQMAIERINQLNTYRKEVSKEKAKRTGEK